MTDLIARIEAAQPSEARDLFEEAFATVHHLGKMPVKDWCAIGWRRADRFVTLLNASAYLDAAAMFVPEGYDWIVGHTNGGLTIYAECGGTGGDFTRFAATPYFALLSAAMKARQTDEQ